jgi:hypothetical protein
MGNNPEEGQGNVILVVFHMLFIWRWVRDFWNGKQGYERRIDPRWWPLVQMHRAMITTIYPDRLYRVERRVVRSRIVVVIRRRRLGTFDWAKALKEAA